MAEAAERYSEAFLDGAGAEAFEMLSERCRDRLDKAEFLAIVMTAGEMYGPQDFILGDVEVADGMARVSYEFSNAPQLAQDREPWVLEDGRWKVDDC